MRVARSGGPLFVLRIYAGVTRPLVLQRVTRAETRRIAYCDAHFLRKCGNKNNINTLIKLTIL